MKLSSDLMDIVLKMRDFQSSCRFCLKPTSEFSVNIFEEEEHGCFADEIVKVVSVKVDDLPHWPQTACFDCVELLQQMLTFQQLCISSYNTILQEVTRHTELKEEPPANEDPIKDEFKGEVTGAIPNPFDGDFLPDPQEMPFGPEHREIVSAISLPVVDEVLAKEKGIEYIPPPPQDVEMFDENGEPVKRKKKKKKKSTRTWRKKPDDRYRSVVCFNRRVTEEEQRLEEIMLERCLFVCQWCTNLDLGTYRKLFKHVAEEHAGREYHICCNVTLKKIHTGKLYDHIRWHLDKNTFACQECKYIATSSVNLGVHMNKIHPKSTWEYICETCGKTFPGQGILNKHVTEKHGERSCICPHCKKVFSNPYNLNLHVLHFHEKVVKFLCDLCGKGYPTWGLLQSHLLDHGGPHGGRRKKKPKVPQTKSALVVTKDTKD